MELLARITADLKEAMKAHEADKVNLLRMLTSALKNKAIEKGKDAVITEEEAIAAITREAKKRKESVVAFMAGGRPDLADKETAELAIIEKYLPVMMSLEETTAAVDKILAGLADKSNAGLVMKAVMQEMKGKADGKMVSELVKAKLG